MARTHVILDDSVLAAIDEVAGERGRSAFLEGAAREKLQRLQLLAALDETAGMLDGEATPSGVIVRQPPVGFASSAEAADDDLPAGHDGAHRTTPRRR